MLSWTVLHLGLDGVEISKLQEEQRQGPNPYVTMYLMVVGRAVRTPPSISQKHACHKRPSTQPTWGHKAHDAVPDEVAERVHKRVLEGIGFIGLHSAHFSKPLQA